MRNQVHRLPKTNSSSRAPQPALALFLGTKVLDELRILMRLATPNGASAKLTPRRLTTSELLP